MKRPDVQYPTLVSGRIDGLIRCESINGLELWLQPGSRAAWKPGDAVENAIAEFHDFKPFEFEGNTYGVSHLQKKARFFSLRYDPFIYHWGKFWRLQGQDSAGNWLPGTEQGLYWRTPGWRWQVPDANSNWTPWIWSLGRGPGTHLD